MNQKGFIAELIVPLPPRQSADPLLNACIETFYETKEVYDFLLPGFELELLYYLVFKDMMTAAQIFTYMSDSLQSVFDELQETPIEELLSPVGCTGSERGLMEKVVSGELCAYNLLHGFVDALEILYRNLCIDLNFDIYSVSWETDEALGIIRYNIPEVYTPHAVFGDKPDSSPLLYRWLNRQRYSQKPRF